MKKYIWLVGAALCVAVLYPLSKSDTRVPKLAALRILGRGNGCSLERSIAIDGEKSKLTEAAKRIEAASRIDGKDGDLVHWSTPHGVFWSPASNPVMPLLSKQVSGFYGEGPRRVQKGDIVLDCGANVGTFTAEALAAGASLVVAIEPSERNVECLRRNFAAEIKAGRVIVYPKGVWHQEETVTLSVDESSKAASIVQQDRAGARKVRIPATTIDKIVAELHLKRVDFIKMDVEGAERYALRGGRDTIKRFRPRMSIATENLSDDPQVVREVVRELNPSYREECGPCRQVDEWNIQADAFYFF